MKSVRRRATGERSGDIRLAGLEIRARAEHRVRVDHGSGVAPRNVLAEFRLINRLVVNASVGRRNPHLRVVHQDFAFFFFLAASCPKPSMSSKHALRVLDVGTTQWTCSSEYSRRLRARHRPSPRVAITCTFSPAQARASKNDPTSIENWIAPGSAATLPAQHRLLVASTSRDGLQRFLAAAIPTAPATAGAGIVFQLPHWSTFPGDRRLCGGRALHGSRRPRYPSPAASLRLSALIGDASGSRCSRSAADLLRI